MWLCSMCCVWLNEMDVIEHRSPNTHFHANFSINWYPAYREQMPMNGNNNSQKNRIEKKKKTLQVDSAAR